MKKIFIYLLLAIFVTGSSLLAPTTASAKTCDYDFYSLNDMSFYDPCSTCGGGANTGGGSGQPLPMSIPEYWRTLIDSTAGTYPDVDRRLVAATLWVENRGWPDPNKTWAVSDAGAAGPWQFIDSTWQGMATDGDGDGHMDRNNPKDEVHAAFKHMAGSAGKPLINGATGDLQADYNNAIFQNDHQSLVSYLASYNGGSNGDDYMNGTTLASFGRDQISDYVRMGYWLIGTNFDQVASDNGAGPLVSAADGAAGGGGSSGSGSGAGAACTVSATGTPAGSVVWYAQCDDKWAGSPYSSGGTMCDAGCGPTAMAMILTGLVDKNITPPDVAAAAGDQSGSEAGTNSIANLLNGVSAKWGVTIQQDMTFTAAVDFVKSGKGYVLIQGRGGLPFTDGGHIVALVGISADGNSLTIADPATLPGHNHISDYPISAIATYGNAFHGVEKKLAQI